MCQTHLSSIIQLFVFLTLGPKQQVLSTEFSPQEFLQ